MARIRTVKPALFRHEELYEQETKTKLPLRVAWMGLFTVADREGRFEWKPRILKLDILPWDEIDFQKVLSALESLGMIKKYQAEGKFYGYIPTFKQHQNIRPDEAKSLLPAPPMPVANEITTEQILVRNEPVTDLIRVDNVEKEEEEEEEGTEQIAETSSAHSSNSLLEDEFTKPILDRVKREVQEAWIELYQDPGWIQFEIKKAVTWCKANPRKAPKSNYERFINSWLATGWENHRKKLNSNSSARRNLIPINPEDLL